MAMRHEKDPAGSGADSSDQAGGKIGTSSVADAGDVSRAPMSASERRAAYIENFQRRVIQDALAEATSAYWRRRARQFEGCGTASADEKAQACRNHATICEFQNFDEIYDAVVAEFVDETRRAA